MSRALQLRSSAHIISLEKNVFVSEGYKLQNNKNVKRKLKCMVGEIEGRGAATRESISSNPFTATCSQIVKYFPPPLQLVVTEIPFQLLSSYFLHCEIRFAILSELRSN
jgi:hypothetical protein